MTTFSPSVPLRLKTTPALLRTVGLEFRTFLSSAPPPPRRPGGLGFVWEGVLKAEKIELLIKICFKFGEIKICSKFSEIKICSNFSEIKICSKFSVIKICSLFS